MLSRGWQSLLQKLANELCLPFRFNRETIRRCCVLTPYFSPATGKFEWKMKPDDYDYVQELARSAYADMLHDYDRNEKYEAGIRSAVKEMKRRGIEPRVLDIGTGTGLLSMMACRHGVNEVVACEAFLPIAAVAEEIIRDNECGEKIRIVRKRSTDINVEHDMDGKRANILVTEVFDTELIGEGAISTFRHALDHLLTPDCIVVPSLARMYVQVINSDLIWRWHKLHPFDVGAKRIDIPFDAAFPAGDVFYDLQSSEIPLDSFQSLSPPLKVFDFDFTGETRLLDNRLSAQDFVAHKDGAAQAVFMWWDLKMDVEGDVWIDMAPNNVASPTVKELLQKCEIEDDERRHELSQPRPWRDHWMQAIYFFDTERNVKEGQTATLLAKHDEYSLSFDVRNNENGRIGDDPILLSPAILSRSKLGYLNCESTRQKMISCLEKRIRKDSVVCCIGEGSLLPILCAALGAMQVFVIDSNKWTAKLTSSIASHNNLSSRVLIIKKSIEDLESVDFGDRKIDFVVSDMWFQTLSLPWDGLYFSYALKSLKHFLSPSFECLPMRGELKGLCLSMQDLWKIRAPVQHTAQGFDLTKFDRVILSACDLADPLVEPQPLWEYPNSAVSSVRTIASFEMSMFLKNSSAIDSSEVLQKSVEFQLPMLKKDPHSERPFNGIGFWMDWVYDDETVISTGLENEPNLAQSVAWNRNFKQGVFIANQMTRSEMVMIAVSFNPINGDISFQVKAQD